MDIPGGPMVKNLPCNAGDVGLILVRELDSSCHGATKGFLIMQDLMQPNK